MSVGECSCRILIGYWCSAGWMSYGQRTAAIPFAGSTDDTLAIDASLVAWKIYAWRPDIHAFETCRYAHCPELNDVLHLQCKGITKIQNLEVFGCEIVLNSHIVIFGGKF